jgi:hypothetical protein
MLPINLLQVLVQTCLIITLECIPHFTQFQPQSVCASLLDYILVVCMMLTFICITKLTRLWPPSVKHYDLQVHQNPGMIMASKCMSE